MRRRGVTVILGALTTALLAIGVMAAPMPYVVLKPGPTVNTLGSDNGKQVIQVTKADTSESKGQLRLTTVGVQNDVELVWAIRGWFSHEQAVVPRDVIYPPERTEKEVEEQNQQEFQTSQVAAVTVALRELGYPLRVVVNTVNGDGPSSGKLRKGDVIATVAGTPVTSPQKLQELVQAQPPGTALSVGYLRDGKSGTARLVTRKDGSGTPRIGVSVTTDQPHPFDVKIDLNEIGGPSAGLMFSLGIYDKLTPGALAGGRQVAGTGTIDDEGKVGPIGGIQQKIAGARRDGAQLFLVPPGNCRAALGADVSEDEIRLVRAPTLHSALSSIKTFADDPNADLPSCE